MIDLVGYCVCVLLLWVTCYSVGDLTRLDFRVLCDYHLCQIHQSARVIVTIYIYVKTWIDKHFHKSYVTGLFHFSGPRSLKGE